MNIMLSVFNLKSKCLISISSAIFKKKLNTKLFNTKSKITSQSNSELRVLLDATALGE